MKQILFFDGVCNLCNGFVDFIVSRDTKNIFQFAPLQGKTAIASLRKESIDALNTVILFKEGLEFQKSDAALMVLQQLGGGWILFKIFWIIPRFLRNIVYDLVAKNRYRIFGKRESCRLPTKEERARFLE